MLLEKELREIKKYMEKEGEDLGLSKDNLNRILVESLGDIRLTFPSLTSQLELIRLVTRRVASYVDGFLEEDLDDIGLAIDEACTNVISHSYMDSNNQGIIRVEYKIESNKLTIAITDEGEKGQSFNPDTLSEVDKEEYLKNLSRGGLGVHLIKKIMDEVAYTVSPGVHNCLTMVKYTQQYKATDRRKRI